MRGFWSLSTHRPFLLWISLFSHSMLIVWRMLQNKTYFATCLSWSAPELKLITETTSESSSQNLSYVRRIRVNFFLPLQTSLVIQLLMPLGPALINQQLSICCSYTGFQHMVCTSIEWFVAIQWQRLGSFTQSYISAWQRQYNTTDNQLSHITVPDTQCCRHPLLPSYAHVQPRFIVFSQNTHHQNFTRRKKLALWNSKDLGSLRQRRFHKTKKASIMKLGGFLDRCAISPKTDDSQDFR